MLCRLFKKEGRFIEVINFIAQLLLSVIMLPFLKYRASMSVSGKNNLKKVVSFKRNGRGIIFAINHVTQLDVIIVVVSIIFSNSRLVPIHYVSMEKKKYSQFTGVKKYLWGGLLFTMFGAYPAYRGMRDYGKALKNHIDLLKAGKSVGIFPTGKMNKTNEWVKDKARGGVAYLAEQTQSPIVPVRISGLEDFGFKTFMQGKHTLRVTFGEPVFFENIVDTSLSDEDKYQGVSQKVLQTISDL